MGPEPLGRDDPLRQKLLGRVTSGTMIVLVVIYPFVLLRSLALGFRFIFAIQSLIALVLLGIFLARKRLPPQSSALAILLAIGAWLLTAVENYGVLAPAHLVVPFLTILSSIAFGRRIALRVLCFLTLGVGLIGALYLSGILHYQVDTGLFVHSWTSWANLIVLQVMLALWYLFMVAPINDVHARLTERLEAVLEGINDALFIHDKDSGAILQVNQRMCAMYACSPDEAVRLSVGDLSEGSAPYDLEHARAWIAKAVNEGPQLFEWRAKDRQGRLFWVEVNMRLAKLEGTPRILVLVRDISARKQAERDMGEVQANLAILIESTDDLIWSVDLDYRYLTFNRNVQQHIRQTYGTEIRVGATPEECMPAERAAFWKLLFNRALAEGPFRQELLLADGKTYELALNPIVNEGEKVGVSVFAKDISERKRAEAALRESEARFNTAFRFMPVGAGITTLSDGRLLAVNKHFGEVFGYSPDELLGRTTSELGIWVDPKDRDHIVSMLKMGQPVHAYECQIRRKDGSVGWASYSGDLVVLNGEKYLLSGAVDITRRKRAEEAQQEMQTRLNQAQKMEAIGTLAGGIAHDFNNILGGMLGYAELARLELPEESPVISLLENIERGGARAVDLVRQILAFSRRTPQDRKPIQLAVIIKEALKLLRASLPVTIAIHEQYETSGFVLADAGQVHQIVMNLCTNAGLAMRKQGGELGINLREIESDDALLAKHPELSGGRYLCLTVKDTGCGIPSENLGRIFEPFFTTRAVGEGTGLGLSVVHGIVKSWGGSIGVASEVGRGTTFEIILPACAATGANEVERGIAYQGHERVLFVDDETNLTDIAQRGLTHFGYEVAAFDDPLEAIAAFRAKPRDFDIVVTDMTMPRITGDVLAAEVRRVRPDIPVVLVSGFSDRLTAEQARAAGFDGFVDKPLRPTTLAQLIRKLCDRS